MPRYGHSKIGGVPKTPKFEMPITPPLGVLEQKKFGFPSFSIGGTSTPKMIKIGEIGVLSYLHLSWNEPNLNTINDEKIMPGMKEQHESTNYETA